MGAEASDGKARGEPQEEKDGEQESADKRNSNADAKKQGGAEESAAAAWVRSERRKTDQIIDSLRRARDLNS